MKTSPRLVLIVGFPVLLAAAAVVPSSSGALPGTFIPNFGTMPNDIARQASSCGMCHGAAAQGFMNVTAHLDVPIFSLDRGQSISLTTRATGGVPHPQNWAGFVTEVSDGTLVPGTFMKIDATGKFVTHKTARAGGRTWTYGYTAPMTPGPVSVYTVVNTANGDARATGDAWGFVGPDRNDPQNVPVRLYVNAVGVKDAGPGCRGAFGNQPVLGARVSPTVGNGSFGFDLVGAVTGTPVALLIGVRLSTPLDLGLIGISGCKMHVQSVLSSPGLTGPGNPKHGDGTAFFPLPIPNDPGLQTGRLAAQAAIVDVSNGRRLAITMTNAVEVTVQ